MLNLFELEMQMKTQSEEMQKQNRGPIFAGIPLMDWLLGLTGLFALMC
jgi:hypothetical protein